MDACRTFDGMRIVLRASLVKVNRQEETRFVQQHRVYPGDKIAATVIPTRKMPPNHFISNGQKLSIPARSTLDPRLLAEPRHPFIPTSRRIPRFSRWFGSQSGVDRRRGVRERATGTMRSSLPVVTDDEANRPPKTIQSGLCLNQCLK